MTVAVAARHGPAPAFAFLRVGLLGTIFIGLLLKPIMIAPFAVGFSTYVVRLAYGRCIGRLLGKSRWPSPVNGQSAKHGEGLPDDVTLHVYRCNPNVVPDTRAR